jgi:predicted lactoylglutathione lyase
MMREFTSSTVFCCSIVALLLAADEVGVFVAAKVDDARKKTQTLESIIICRKELIEDMILCIVK